MIRVRNIPLYWAIEEAPDDRAFLTGSWMVEDSIPFRASTRGIRIRVSHRHWFHIGLFRYRREALHLGLSFRPTQIGRWGKDAEEKAEPTESILFDFEAGEVTDAGTGASSGDIPQPDGRVVSWTITSGDREWLAAQGDGDPGSPGP